MNSKAKGNSPNFQGSARVSRVGDGVPPSRNTANASFLGNARASRAISGASPETSEGILYSKRHLPHFERPWAKYAVCFVTRERHPLSFAERDAVLESVLYAHNQRQCELYAACVMPDHVHVLFEPQIKNNGSEGKTIFWSLTEILHGIKSVSAHRINKIRRTHGPVWEKESFDRLIRSQFDLAEKFRYVCRNPTNLKEASRIGGYPWLWTPGISSAGAPKNAREARALPEQ